MPIDYSGTWDMTSNEHFEGYMVALGKFSLYLFIEAHIFSCFQASDFDCINMAYFLEYSLAVGNSFMRNDIRQCADSLH